MVDKQRFGKSIDAELFGERVFLIFAVLDGLVGPERYPGEFLFRGIFAFDKCFQRVAIFVLADSNNLKAAVAIFLIVFLYVGYFCDAWRAPRCPEINQNDFAFELGQVEGPAVYAFR